MNPFTQISDYVNKFQITTNGLDAARLTSYIERYEESYLVDMLGVELFDLFIADIQGVPTAPYIFINEAFNVQLSCGTILKSRGVFDMLLGFVYFNYQRDAKTKESINSTVKIKGQNSERANSFNAGIFSRFNDSIDTYKAIQRYVLEHSDVYPTFKGLEKDYSWLTW